MVARSDLLVYTSQSLVRLGKEAGYPLLILPVTELAWRRPIGAIVCGDGYSTAPRAVASPASNCPRTYHVP
jgi:hypothetical protein